MELVEKVHRSFDQRISQDPAIADEMWVRIMKHLNSSIREAHAEERVREVDRLLDQAWELSIQDVINWVNRKRREGWTLGMAPLPLEE